MNWSSQFDSYLPHGMCLLWRPGLMALHVVSDGLIALAYFTIPFAILHFVRSRNDLERPQRALAILFAAFIALCGLTHVASIIVLWVPIYVIEGWLKAATAAVSTATVIWLILLIPDVLKLPSFKSMQREIAAHRDTMLALDAARAALAVRVGRTEDELRLAEQHRHQSVALLRTVIETVPGLIYAKDRSGRMLLANKATLDLIGKEWPDVQGKRDNEFLGDFRQAATIMANDRGVMDAGEARELEELLDHPVKGPRLYLSAKVPFASDGASNDSGVGSGGWGGSVGMVGVSIDITERKRLEMDLLHASRLSAMGEMATAIAHEINQPLAAIALFLDGSLALLANDHYSGPLIEPLSLAKEQCLRAGNIIRRVRSFVSGGGEPRRLEDLPRLVDEACSLALIGSHDSGVAISIIHAEPDIAVLVYRVQIEQVIVNLVRNAMESISGAEGAALQIATGFGAGGMAMVSVSDNGPGISAKAAEDLFKPFTSTKGIKGMGVGLSICRTIIEAHGGKIWVDPDAGTGAIFRFSLPRNALVAA